MTFRFYLIFLKLKTQQSTSYRIGILPGLGLPKLSGGRERGWMKFWLVLFSSQRSKESDADVYDSESDDWFVIWITCSVQV